MSRGHMPNTFEAMNEFRKGCAFSVAFYDDTRSMAVLISRGKYSLADEERRLYFLLSAGGYYATSPTRIKCKGLLFTFWHASDFPDRLSDCQNDCHGQ